MVVEVIVMPLDRMNLMQDDPDKEADTVMADELMAKVSTVVKVQQGGGGHQHQQQQQAHAMNGNDEVAPII